MPVLYINSHKVDLPDGFKISINKELENFNEPAAVRNSYSVQITLDGTKNNNDIFSSFNLPNAIGKVSTSPLLVYGPTNDNLTTTFNPNKKNQFVLLDDQGQIFQRGYVRYDEAVTKGNTIQYKITLFGELGDVIYNLMYNNYGEKKNLASLKYYPFDYPVNNVNGVSNQVDTWDDVRWDANYIKKLWDESSIYNEENKRYILQEPKNKYIMPVLTKRGPIANFDANKITVSYIGMPNVPANTYYSDVTRLMPPVVIDTEQQTVSTTLSGKCQFEYERDLDFMEVGNVCAQSVTPSFYLPAIIEACCNPDNNGGYTINISSKIKERWDYSRQFLLMKNLTFDDTPGGISQNVTKKYYELPDMNKINIPLTFYSSEWPLYFDFSYPSLYTTWNFGFQISRNEYNGMRDNQISLNRRQNGNFMFGGVLVRLYVVNKDNNELKHKWYYLTSNTISGNIVEEGKETITNLLRKDAYGNFISIEFATFDQTLKTLYTNREEIEYTTFPDWQQIFGIANTNIQVLQSHLVDLNLPYSNEVPGNQNLGYTMDTQFVGVRVTQSNIQGRIVYSSSILTQQYIYGNHGGAVVPCIKTEFYNSQQLNPEPDYITNVVLNNRDGDKINKNWNTIITKKKFFEGTSTPADYLLSLMKLYNLYLISDYTKEKTLNLVTIEEFYRLKYGVYDYWGEDVYKETEDEIPTVVLDDKVDYSQPVVIKPYILSNNINVYPNYADVDRTEDYIGVESKRGDIMTPRGLITQESKNIFANTILLEVDDVDIRTKYYNRTNPAKTRYWPMPLLPGKYKQYLYRIDNDGVIQEQEYERFGIYNNQIVYSKTNPKLIEYDVKGINNKGEDVDLMNALVFFDTISKNYQITLYDAEDSIVNNSNAANLLGLWSSKDGYGKTILHTVDRYPMSYSHIDVEQKYKVLKNLNTDIQQTVTLYIKINVSNIDELFRNIYQWENNLYIITKCENITIGGEQPIKITMVRIPYKNFTV